LTVDQTGREMKKRVLLFTLLTIAVACNTSNPNQPTANSNSQSNSNQSAQNSNSENPSGSATTAPVTAPPSSSPPTQLVGTYTISEVHSGGMVTMIRPQVATQITFGPGQDFVRISKSPGKRDFKDSGQFEISGDQLTLKIVMSAGKIQIPVVERKHQFRLSEDGSEMRLTAKDGKIAVFRK
jgi:hypothetical protein